MKNKDIVKKVNIFIATLETCKNMETSEDKKEVFEAVIGDLKDIVK